MSEDKRIKILFVDDEENVLQALRRSLRGMREEWDMHYLSGGKTGLELLEKQPMDMIVSDMYMPEMNGAVFLREVKKRHPGIIRIILSGHSDYDLILETILPAHTFLHKPCSKDGLIKKINSIQQFKKLVGKKDVREEITEIGTLPSQPLFYPLFNEALQNGAPKEIAEIITYDVAMVANILKVLMNSFLGEVKQLPSLEEAASMLGKDTLDTLINSQDLFVSYQDISCPQLPIYTLWRHCFRTAKYAAAIAAEETADKDMVNRCFMAGLLHDVGKYILLLKFYPQYYELLQIQEEHPETGMLQKEIAAFGATHGTIGAYLMSLWGLPRKVVQAIAFHEMPKVIKESEFSPLIAVHAANAFDHYLQKNLWGSAEAKLDMESLKCAGIHERTKTWFNTCKEIHNNDIKKLKNLVF